MQTVRILNKTRGTVLGERIGVADSSLSRMVGLLGKSGLAPATGLLIMPSQAVHSIGMRFPIDVLFMDRNWRVIHIQPSMRPYRISGLHWRARCVLELPVGAIAETCTLVGDVLQIEDLHGPRSSGRHTS
jgi:uncharacterized membrane protein (UPF0127 family)